MWMARRSRQRVEARSSSLGRVAVRPLFREISAQGNVNIYSYTGLWATFRLMGDAERWDSAGSGYNLEWVVRIGGKPATLASGAPVAVRVMLDMGGAPPFFKKGSLAGLRCVSQVAK